MKNITAFKTADDLKSAGFPQPAPAPGQFWHNSDLGVFVVGPRMTADEGLVKIFYLHTSKAHAKEEASFSECVYAPDVADILFHLREHDLTYWHPQEIYYVEDTRNGIQWVNENPAEAAALAYLELKKQ